MADEGVIQKAAAGKFEAVGLMTATDTEPTITIGGVSITCNLLSAEPKDNTDFKENKGTKGSVVNINARHISDECSISFSVTGATATAAIAMIDTSKPAPLATVVIAGVHAAASAVSPNGSWFYKDGWSTAFTPDEHAVVKMNLIKYPDITPA